MIIETIVLFGLIDGKDCDCFKRVYETMQTCEADIPHQPKVFITGAPGEPRGYVTFKCEIR